MVWRGARRLSLKRGPFVRRKEMEEERIVSDCEEDDTDESKLFLFRFEDYFLSSVLRLKGGTRGRGGGGGIYTRNPCGISFRSFTAGHRRGGAKERRERAVDDRGGREGRKKGCEQPAAKRGKRVTILEGTRRRREAKRKGSITHISPSATLSSRLLFHSALEHSPITPSASNQPSKQFHGYLT